MSLAFEDFLTDHRVAFNPSGPKTRRGWINFACPYCGRTPYMGYNISLRYVNCWNCGRHPLVETMALLSGLSATQCYNLMQEIPCAYRVDMIRAGKYKEPVGVVPMLLHHRDYLASRKLQPQVIRRLWEVEGLGQSAEGSYLRWRLFIPIYFRGDRVSWTTRTIVEGKEPRYLSAKAEESAIPIENCLYGVDYCRNAVIVCEGPVDVWTIGPGAVALLGLRASPSQLAQLSHFPLRVVCLDNEPKAQERANKLCDDLSVFEGVTVNVTLNAKDAASADPHEIESLRKEFLT